MVNPIRYTTYKIYFILGQHYTCFGRSFRPSSGVYDCTYNIRQMSYRFCGCLLASVARVLLQNKINLRYCASGWFTIEIYYDARSYKHRTYILKY